jgi:hypothetical protein
MLGKLKILGRAPPMRLRPYQESEPQPRPVLSFTHGYDLLFYQMASPTCTEV